MDLFLYLHLLGAPSPISLNSLKNVFGSYKWIPRLSPTSDLFPVWDTTLGLCSMSESSQSACLWKPDNPLMERSSVIVVCTLHLPPNIWRFIEEEGWAAGGCAYNTPRWLQERRQEGKYSREWRELLWPGCGGHNAQVEFSGIIWLLRTNNNKTALAVWLEDEQAWRTKAKKKASWKLLTKGM